jgi:hypothetical protein
LSRRRHLSRSPPKSSLLIVLCREVDGLAEIKKPVLQHIAGHRNREVYEYLELTHDVRDSRAAAIYSA